MGGRGHGLIVGTIPAFADVTENLEKLKVTGLRVEI